MRRFLHQQWLAFRDSYDADEATEVASGPSGTLVAVVCQACLLILLGYAPFVSDHAQFRHPWIAIFLTCLGGTLTLAARRLRCRGPIGTAATLFDSVCWSAALGFSAVNTSGGISVALAVIQAAVLLGFTTQWYSLTLLLGLGLTVPTFGLLICFPASEAVQVIMVATQAMALLMSHTTGRRRALLEHKRKLEQAVGALSQLADDSMQAALFSTQQTLGRFLHELRNYQTAAASNLEYLEATCKLVDTAQAALLDAHRAQTAQTRLVRSTIDELRRKGRTEGTDFLLYDSLQQFAERERDFEVVADCASVPITLTGNPAHLNLVLHHLIRNSRQAGAKHVAIDARMVRNGRAVRMVLHDDGPGIGLERRANLFQPVLESADVLCGGLGLYLCRRYVELLGGTITHEDGPMGGASFVLELPATGAPTSHFNLERKSIHCMPAPIRHSR